MIAIREPVVSIRRWLQITALGAAVVPLVKIRAQVVSSGETMPGSVASTSASAASSAGPTDRTSSVANRSLANNGAARSAWVGS